MVKPKRFNKNFKTGEDTIDANNWGTVKFVPKVPNSANSATPWREFKDDLMEKQREGDTSNAVDMDSAEAKNMLKQREQNYRRMLITEQSKQPTKWESFEDGSTKAAPSSSGPPGAPSSSGPKYTLLKNVNFEKFDPRDLNFKQKNSLRKAISKNLLVYNGNLKNVIGRDKNMKLLKKKREENKANASARNQKGLKKST